MFQTTDTGGIGIRIVQIPQSVQSNPLSGAYIVQPLNAGSVVSQPVEISNTSNQTLHAIIYPGAAAMKNGNFTITSAGVQNELSSWVTVSPASAVIPAHGHITAVVTFTVPQFVHVGTQYGVIWASIASKPSIGGIVNVNRVGVRMYIPVSGAVKPATTSTSHSPSWYSLHTAVVPWILSGLLFTLLLTIGLRRVLSRFKGRR